MSYALALTSDKKVKFMVATKSCKLNVSAFNSPVKQEVKPVKEEPKHKEIMTSPKNLFDQNYEHKNYDKL
jgi:hypothetical protein